jgi:hypothetical protein
MVGGSDAHFPSEVGASFIEISDSEDPEEIRKILLSGDFSAYGKKNSLLYHAGTKIIKLLKR